MDYVGEDLVETGLATFDDRQAVDAVIGLHNSRPVSLVRYMYGGPTDLLE